MTRRTRTFQLFALFIFMLTCAAHAEAQGQPNRTWVETTGNNANPCNRALPCRDFSFAIAAVAAGGEVVVLDSGGYGAVEITKSVQIIAPRGVHAGIAPAAGLQVPGYGSSVTAAVVVNAPGATVVLRNLFINRQGSTGWGIFAVEAAALHVEACTVSGFSGTGAGIDFRANGQLTVRDTTLRHNDAGIHVNGPAGGMARVSIDRCRLERNDIGLYAADRSRVTASNTVVTGRRFVEIGFYLVANVGQVAELNCSGCVVNNLGWGYWNQGGASAVMRVARSVVTNNDMGFYNYPGGTFESLGNNTVRGNGADISGTITTVPQT